MFINKETQAVPNVTFKLRANDEWAERSTNEIFKNRTVVVFSLPGAFTPTCSSTHLPGYDELAPKLFANGVDEIICMSVNDTFVMNSWSADQNTKNISFIPDGNGDFTEAMGLLVDKSDIGFGKRSWRYAMLVKDGIIDKMFIEPEVPGDPFEVSDATTMLKYINPEAVSAAEVAVISKPNCPFCTKAKALLVEKGYQFEELELGKDLSLVALKAITNATAVPQIFINGELIGGSDKLEEHFQK